MSATTGACGAGGSIATPLAAASTSATRSRASCWRRSTRGGCGSAEGTLLEPGCWLTLAPEAEIEIGAGCFLNRNTMIAAHRSVRIGDHTMFANGCFVGDAEHRFDDPELPITWQGFTTKGPVEIGANCWFGVNCAVASGVTVGERCVIGANSVVTRDIEAATVSAGAPAKPLRKIDFR